MAKSAKPRKRTSSTQAKSKPNKFDAAVRGSFSLNILRLAEYSTMNVLNGNGVSLMVCFTASMANGASHTTLCDLKTNVALNISTKNWITI